MEPENVSHDTDLGQLVQVYVCSVKDYYHNSSRCRSDDVEGEWIPVTGYKFIYEGDTFVDTVWDPGKRYDDLKVMSLAGKDQYKPFPGYTFTQPGKSLLVVWTPGIVNSDNPRLIAGTSEGSWKVNASPSRRSSNRAVPWIVGRALWYAL